MWHVALKEIVRHARDPAPPAFQTAVVTMSIPATPRPGDPLYLALVEKVQRMTRGVDVNGNEDSNGRSTSSPSPRATSSRTSTSATPSPPSSAPAPMVW
jgi:hypothetical protein